MSPCNHEIAKIKKQMVMAYLKVLLFQGSTILSGGHAVAHLVEALRYKSEGRGFDSRLCHWHFSLI